MSDDAAQYALLQPEAAFAVETSVREYIAGLALLYGAAVVNRVAHSPMCNWMFQCGCRPLWGSPGGWSTCNVHQRVNPRCPWCLPWLQPETAGWFHLWRLDSAIGQDGLATLSLAAPLAWWWRSARDTSPLLLARALALAAGAFAASELLVGAVYGVLYRYPYFILWRPLFRAQPRPEPRDAGDGLDSSGQTSLAASLVVGATGGVVWALVIAAVALAWRRRRPCINCRPCAPRKLCVQ